MSEKAIIVENLWKGYQLGSGKSGSFRETLSSLFSPTKKEKDTFWALQDINFSINKGEAVGIIGRNGAGKSTLLKILSRITAPTKGGFELNGRVSSLLEVGTGFHPELTGRENIYLNGTILGMTRAEVKIKFDEIVAFSGIEKFIDTPVKRYSSGMFVRLAFAVAAHLEPEILIVDEVLAVGDAEFQKKCLGKMRDVSSNEGRTVIFVSHDLRAIQFFCNKSILLNNSKLVDFDDTSKITSTYLKSMLKVNNFTRNYDGGIKITNVTSELNEHELEIYLNIKTDKKISFAVDVRLKDSFFIPIGYGTIGTKINQDLITIEEGDAQVKLSLLTNDLASGLYYVSIDITNPNIEYYDRLDDVINFELLPLGTKANKFLNQNWNYGSYQLSVSLR